MKTAIKIHHPLKTFRLGWHYQYSTYPTFDPETFEKDTDVFVWMFEIHFAFLTFYTGSMGRLEKPKHLRLIKE